MNWGQNKVFQGGNHIVWSDCLAYDFGTEGVQCGNHIVCTNTTWDSVQLYIIECPYFREGRLDRLASFHSHWVSEV